MLPPTSDPRRILFLDDDPDRASTFLMDCPGATWVETAEQCLARLSQAWDEVHLDHDLGGEVFVDHERDDCGMAVVRWLCDEPRAHLLGTTFVVHTRNLNAACVMQLHLEMVGYTVVVRPFRRGGSRQVLAPIPGEHRTIRERIMRWLRKFASA